MTEFSQIHICFVIPAAYSLYNTNTHFPFGGAEVRSSLFAKELAKHTEFKISVIVNNHGQNKEIWDDVHVYPHSGYHDSSHWLTQARGELKDYAEIVSNFPYVKILKPHLRLIQLLARLSIHRLLEQAKSFIYARQKVTLRGRILPFDKYQIYDVVDADVYCVFGTKPRGSEVAAYCKARNKKFILFGASDRNFTALTVDDALKDRDENSIVAAQCIIDNADLIITQTTQQADLLKENLNRKSQIISNPIALNSIKAVDNNSYALWIGRSHPEKNPQLFLDLAKYHTQIQFVMIMNRSDDLLYGEIKQQCPNNLSIIEHVAFIEIDDFFANAFVLVNTSPMEGFPNTFLQAGKYKTPILSYQVDPDGYLSEWGCGVVANGHLTTMNQALQRLYDDIDWRKMLGENHHSYVVGHHNLIDKVDQLATYVRHLFNEVG